MKSQLDIQKKIIEMKRAKNENASRALAAFLLLIEINRVNKMLIGSFSKNNLIAFFN